MPVPTLRPRLTESVLRAPPPTRPSRFPALLRAGLVVGRIREANGWKQTYFEAGHRGGPLTVLLHGYPGSPAFSADLVEPLVRAGRHVIIPTLRWLTPKDADASGKGFGLDVIAHDVEALAETFSEGPFNLVTHDYGSLIGYQVNPAKVSRLVTMAIPHPGVTLPTSPIPLKERLTLAYRARHFFEIPAHLPGRYVETSLDAFVQRLSPGFTPDLAEFRHALEEPSVRSAVWRLYTRYGVNAGLDMLGRKLRMYQPTAVPTLAFAGAEDGGTPLEVFAREDAFHRSGTYERVVLPGTAHFIPEQKGDVIAPRIVAFLGGEGDRTGWVAGARGRAEGANRQGAPSTPPR